MFDDVSKQAPRPLSLDAHQTHENNVVAMHYKRTVNIEELFYLFFLEKVTSEHVATVTHDVAETVVVVERAVANEENVEATVAVVAAVADATAAVVGGDGGVGGGGVARTGVG